MKKQSRRRYIDKPYGSGTFITETKQAASSKAVGKKDSIKNFKSGPVKILSESDILQINNEYVVKRPTTQQREMVIAIAKKKKKKTRASRDKKTRFCLVCGRQKNIPAKKRTCTVCCVLSPDVRRSLRAKRKQRHSSVWAVSGGLPTLGKRR
jgi:hypothetical protein